MSGREELLRVHGEAHIERIRQLAEAGGGMIDMDTVASEGSWRGGALTPRAAPPRRRPRARPGAPRSGSPSAACARPATTPRLTAPWGSACSTTLRWPRRHALAAHGVERVLICDWDVHHGNGTEAIFYEAPEVLYASIHQAPLYPGTGAAADVGSGPARGTR